MDLPARVQVRHRFNGDVVVLTPENDGYIGSWSDGTFELEAAPLSGVDVLRVDQASEISFPRPLSAEGRRDVFVIPIQILEERTGLKVTKFPTNHVKVVRHDSRLFRMWEVAVSAQNDNGRVGFFLTTQFLYGSPIFRNREGKLLLPEYEGFNRWPQLQGYLDIVLQDKDKLPVLTAPPQRKSVPTSELKDGEGIVIWYNLARGYGAIATRRGNARVHWSQIADSGRFKFLKEGQRVTFESLAAPVNTQRFPRTTNFQKDAVGVRAA